MTQTHSIVRYINVHLIIIIVIITRYDWLLLNDSCGSG